MDKLDSIFKMQQALNDEICQKRHLGDISPDEWQQKLTLAMLSELAEGLEATSFKWWKNKKDLGEDYLKEEIVDMLHFLVSMALRSGMDADELYSRYVDKNKENFDRQNGLSAKKGYVPGEEA